MQARHYVLSAMSSDAFAEPGVILTQVPDQRAAKSVLRELRSTRQGRRLGDTDWYDIAYRVYLFALVGLALVVWVSDAIDGAIGDGVESADLLARGPSIIGLIAVAAFALGLRSGADGGPIAIEVADIRHVLSAPISRRSVMLRPVAQRLRSAAFALGLGGAVFGQLVATDVEGSRAAWAAAFGAFGAVVGVTFVATAVITHTLRVPRWLATALAATAVAWQGAVAWGIWTDEATGLARVGPGNLAGRLALWGISQRPIDLVAVAMTLAIGTAALLLGGRLRVEALARRGELVSQLRFAATVQDLRTVVQLRRQLRSEVLRTRPWGQRRWPARPEPGGLVRARPTATLVEGSRPKPAASVVWRRDSRSLRRLPAARYARIALLAAIGGLGATLTLSSSPLFGLLLVGALFFAGLESLEPLSQEVDRPDLTDGVPIDRGWIFTHHLVASAVLLVAIGSVGAAIAVAIDPSLGAMAFAVAIPMAWAGALGPVVVTVLDAPTPASPTTLLGAPRDAESVLVPPEFAGFSTAVRTVIPVAISAVGAVPVFVARFSDDAASVARSAVGLVLFTVLVVVWVRRRDPWTTRIRTFFEEGRAATA
jgi:hypothetical protein